MKKIILIITGVIVLGTVGLAIYISKKNNTAPAGNQPFASDFKPLPKPTIPAGDTITLNTSSGNLTVNNFLKNAVKIIDSSIYIKDSADYKVIYVSDGNNFLISLSAYTPDQAQAYRLQAENDLLNALGTSKSNACKLQVSVRVPYSYSAELSDTDYHLSFCPNSLPIPGVDNSSQNQPIRAR